MRRNNGDLLAVVGLVVEAGLIEFFLRHLLTRPFYYDEASRAYEIALGRGFIAHLHIAAAPLALGWVGIENAARFLLGDTEAGLRAPMFLALPLLGVATYLLARRWLGIGVSFCTAAVLLANLWIINYALQLKPYSYEALLAVAAVALYLRMQRTTRHPAQLLGLSALLGLTCVFSLPNLFVVGPLLALDLVQAIRARREAALRIAAAGLAGAIALAHYLAFVRPQAGLAGTTYFASNLAPHGLGALARFTIHGLESYVPTMVTGIAGGAANLATPSYALPPVAHHLLAAALAVLLAAGVVVAAKDAAARALVVAAGGALLLELLASALHRWPFGLLRVNIFVLPLLYILGAIGAVWLASMLRGPRRSDDGRYIRVALWRAIGLGVGAVVLAAAGAAGAMATAQATAQTRELAAKPSWFGGTKAAVAYARLVGTPGDLVIIRADRSTPIWYAAPWLYYMEWYRGYPAAVAARPRIPVGNTISVRFATPGAVDRFLSAHPGSHVIFLLEYELPGGTFPRWAHRQSLATLRKFGYCATREIRFPYTGHLTVLVRTPRCLRGTGRSSRRVRSELLNVMSQAS